MCPHTVYRAPHTGAHVIVERSHIAYLFYYRLRYAHVIVERSHIAYQISSHIAYLFYFTTDTVPILLHTCLERAREGRSDNELKVQRQLRRHNLHLFFFL
jgi:hypothetical protein